MHVALRLAIGLVGIVAPLGAAVAQEPYDVLTPRAIADSTYAVRLAVNELSESIRHNQPDARRFRDPAFLSALTQLSSAAGARTRRPPRADLGGLWDFEITLSDFEPEGKEVLRVQAKFSLVSERDSTGEPLTLTFRRRGDHWDLVAYDGVAARLTALAGRLRGATPR